MVTIKISKKLIIITEINTYIRILFHFSLSNSEMVLEIVQTFIRASKTYANINLEKKINCK